MSTRIPPSRLLRLIPRSRTNIQCLHRTPPPTRILSQRRSLATTPKPVPVSTRLDPITSHRLEHELQRHYKRRFNYAATGVVLGMMAIWITATYIPLDLSPKPVQADSGRRADDPLVVLGKEKKIVIQKLGEEPEEVVDSLATGTSTVPTFPRVLEYYDDGEGPASNEDRMVEYQCLGLGLRTVSFLGIEVYVVGFYIATDDIALLQEALIRKIDPIASTLVAGEKEKLKAKLYDPEEGVEIWNDILKSTGIRTLVRIVPTKNTDFGHLKDAWVRHLTARAQSNKEEFGDESFGVSIQEFKTLFNRGSVPKGKELVLSRDPKGKVAVWYDDGKKGAIRLGQVRDERISRGLWLNYLAGKTVASEPARKSIIDGVMEFVERPVGTVATQVVQHNL